MAIACPYTFVIPMPSCLIRSSVLYFARSFLMEAEYVTLQLCASESVNVTLLLSFCLGYLTINEPFFWTDASYFLPPAKTVAFVGICPRSLADNSPVNCAGYALKLLDVSLKIHSFMECFSISDMLPFLLSIQISTSVPIGCFG